MVQIRFEIVVIVLDRLYLEYLPLTDISRDAQSEDCALKHEAALEHLADAWIAAEDEGIGSLVLAHASMSAALAAMVSHHGEYATAEMVASLVKRIRDGEYSLTRSLQ